jgi:hypothetical protein
MGPVTGWLRDDEKCGDKLAEMQSWPLASLLKDVPTEVFGPSRDWIVHARQLKSLS